MSISAISSNLVDDLSQQQNPGRQIRQGFRQLASALQNGDLTDAQSAYSSIQQVQQAPSGSSNSSGSNTLQNDFATLGQDLQLILTVLQLIKTARPKLLVQLLG